MKKILVSTVLIIVLYVLAWRLIAGPEFMGMFNRVAPGFVFALAVVGFLSLLMNGIVLKAVLSPFDIRLPMGESFGIASITAMGNYLTLFGGGTAGKAVYLKRRYDFPYSKFLASMSAVSILDLMWVGFLGSSMLIVTYKILFPWGQALLSVFLILTVVSFLVLSFGSMFYEKRFFKNVKVALDGWEMIRSSRDLLLKVSLLLLANHLLSSAELFIGYSVFSINISVADAVLLGAISSLSSIIRFTPASIGIQEAVIASSSHLLNIGFGEGLLVAGFMRVVSTGIVFLFGGLCAIGFGNRKYNLWRQIADR